MDLDDYEQNQINELDVILNLTKTKELIEA